MRKECVAKVFTQEAKLESIADIEPGLGRLWTQLNQDINSEDFAVIMRACMSNLIIYCDTPIEVQNIDHEIAAIVDDHPARVIMLTDNGSPGSGTIEAGIQLYYTELDHGWQVCAERIDITAPANMKDRLPSVVRSLLIGDLPTTFWWASQRTPSMSGEVFLRLAELANQVIYDNVGWVNPAQGVATMTRWVEAQQNTQIVHNLAWRRFTNWRKLISQVLDPQAAPSALDNLHTIEVSHGPHALPTVWLLMGWLSDRLNWQAVDGKRLSDSELVWRFRHKQQAIKVQVRRLPEGDPLIYRLLFDWSSKEHPARVCFERLDRERICIKEAESTMPSRLFTSQVPERCALVTAQLAQRTRDKIFESALKASQAMAAVFQQ